ncbi:MAG: septal ring lytic transglycosylase RlpA family protein [Bradyrhizobium sp.]|uniref:septal ring lytic transglycosylase RlpA family protein n=1 Tax=Bradyrhizobium sp. TaxID=376 RepID=UPI002901506D|nr:septal ring lytic transglycosylase RlpA family protein [Bradyrhizobium sp.]MDU3130844.1 septal ring lytic transglycosylase RlpA family protein [Bradyrhizobium sp.]
MLKLKNLSAGKIAGSRTALAVAVTLIVGGSATEASARSRHHHHHARHHHHHMARQAAQPAADSFSNGWSSNGSSWMNANASVTPTSGTGRTFSGMASYYGNESGSRTASGQRMNATAMTCAHRSLPFGTKLRVTHGGQSVIVTVNDRGPFIRGRVLDLSTGAARAIGLTRAGVGRVTAEVVS